MRRDVHYQTTYSLAIEAGFDPTEAEQIAAANKKTDKDYPATVLSGLGSLFSSQTNYSRHFNAIKSRLSGKDSRDKWAEYYLNLALETGDVSRLGQGLHSVQDKHAHQGILAQTDVSIFGKKIIATKWRDDPKINREGFLRAQRETSQYLQRFLRSRASKNDS